jgi:hypothetical protein
LPHTRAVAGPSRPRRNRFEEAGLRLPLGMDLATAEARRQKFRFQA